MFCASIKDHSSNTIVFRTEGYTYTATVCVLCLDQGPFSVSPCQALYRLIRDHHILKGGGVEAQVEVGLPDSSGREQILRILIKTMASHGAVADDVRLDVVRHNPAFCPGSDEAQPSHSLPTREQYA